MTSSEREQHDRFMQLFLENEEALRGFLRSLVPTRQDAQELMQEVAAVLWRKFEQLESPQDYRRWAFGVARMQGLAFRRDRARDRHTFDEELLAMLAAEMETAQDLLDAQRQALDSCLEKLPATQRALVTAVYHTGTKIEQVAQVMGKTPMSLYKLLHRIRVALLNCVTSKLKREGYA